MGFEKFYVRRPGEWAELFDESDGVSDFCLCSLREFS